MRLRETYGITEAEYLQMYEASGGKCWICGGHRKVLCVDHDHRLERDLLEEFTPLVAARRSVRGLLCRRCNGRLLTSALDNPDTLRAAANYLEQMPAQEFLSA